MAFEYGTLTGPKSTLGSIRSWVNYELVDVEGVLLDAQAYIYGALRTREMRATAAFSLALNDQTEPLPTGFLEPIKLIYSTGETIEPKEESELIVNRGEIQSGQPFEYAIYDELFQFEVKADAAYTGTILYWKRSTYLGAQNRTNFLTTRYPNLLRVACLMHAADMVADSEYERWKKRTDELIGRANVEADLARKGADYTVSVR
jgi:hypothetical protein